MWIKPAPGRQVRDPVTRQLVPEAGFDVPDHDPYWRRRLRDGDVIKGVKPTKRRSPPAAEPAGTDAAPPAVTEEH